MVQALKKKLPGSRCVSHRCPKLASSTPRRRCRAPSAMLSSLTQPAFYVRTLEKKTPNWRWMRLSLQFKKVLFSKAKPSLEIRQGENPDIQMLTGWSTIFSKKLRSSTWLHVSVSVLYHQYHPILVETPDRRAAKAWNSCRKNPDLAGELQNLNLFGAS